MAIRAKDTTDVHHEKSLLSKAHSAEERPGVILNKRTRWMVLGAWRCDRSLFQVHSSSRHVIRSSKVGRGNGRKEEFEVIVLTQVKYEANGVFAMRL